MVGEGMWFAVQAMEFFVENLERTTWSSRTCRYRTVRLLSPFLLRRVICAQPIEGETKE